MDGFMLIKYWVLFGVSNGLIGLACFLYAGTLPPPMHHKKVKVRPELTTLILIIGITLMLMYGTPDLYDHTYKFFFG